MADVKEELMQRFKMKDLGKLHHCLGMVINHDEEKGCLLIHQKPYIESMLKRFGLSEAKSVSTPANLSVKMKKDDESKKLADATLYQSIVGSLLYLAIATQPDISQAVGVASKYCSCPTETHLTAAKRILRYLKETTNLALKYEKSDDGKPIGYSDADWAGDYDDHHSTSGIIFTLSNGAVSWYSKKQPVVALSTAEAEYISLSAATQETIWLRRLLKDLSCCTTKDPTTIREDNQGAIAIAKNPVYHSRTKHIDIKYHYICEAIQDKAIQLEYCPTEEMLADILTKPLACEKFEKLREKMGLQELIK